MTRRRTDSREAHGVAVGTHRGAVGFAVAVLCFTASARACPMCRDSAPANTATTQPAPGASAGLDFNASIYAMLGVVAVVGTGVGRAMVKAVRG